MSAESAHTRWWQIFEAVFGVPFLAGVVLQFAAPLGFPGGLVTPARIAVGAALFIVGVALVVRARREFARRSQPTDPSQPTSAIVTTGVFAFSRNPLYLGGACTLAGLALALNLPWALASLIPALVACHYVLIAPEERYLAARFGAEYRVYAAAVHRWVGRRRH